MGPAELREIEPEVAGVAGLWIPETGVVDYGSVALAFARRIENMGGEIRTGFRVLGVRQEGGRILVVGTGGDVCGRSFVNCAGLYSDRVARMCGLNPEIQIIPIRGEYYEVVPDRRHLVQAAIYPVPDPRFPFLGVHFTRSVHDVVEAGPNAVVATHREGYTRRDVSWSDISGLFGYPGFWRMSARYWRAGAAEVYRSLRKSVFVRDLQKLIPAISDSDLVPAQSGVRAQAVDRDGKLLDDFRILRDKQTVHLLNAPSPAATASISIGRTLAAEVARVLA